MILLGCQGLPQIKSVVWLTVDGEIQNVRCVTQDFTEFLFVGGQTARGEIANSLSFCKGSIAQVF